MQEAAVELHERLEHIRYQTSYEKWQEHIAQHIDKPYGSTNECHCDKEAYYSVKCKRTGHSFLYQGIKRSSTVSIRSTTAVR